MPDREYGGGSYNSGYGSGGYASQGRGSTVTSERPSGSSGRSDSGGGGGGGRESPVYRSPTADNTAAALNAQRAAQEAAQAAAAQRAAVQAQQQDAVRAALQRQAQEEAAQRARVQSQQAAAVQAAIKREALLNKAVSKMIGIESGGDPNAKAKLSSAEGLLQFTKDTWMKTLSKYRPDLIEGKTEKEALALRTDPNISFEMGVNLARENAAILDSRGIPVNEKSLYMSHFLGVGDASKVLSADPNAPVSSVVQERSVTANPTILGGGKTVADLNQWASSKIGQAKEFNIADLPAVSGTPATSGVTMRGPNEAYTGGFNTPSGFNPETVAPASQQRGLFDALFGGEDAEKQRIAELEKAGRTAIYPGYDSAYVKQLYADEFAGGDLSKVRTRISDFGQGPVAEYYTKDLGDVAGEAISGLLGGVGNLFGGSRDQAVRGPNEAYGGSAIAPGSIFGNLFSGTPRADYGPYGNLTAEQYRQQYGGRDVAQLAPVAQAPVAPVAAPQPTQQFAGIPTAEELARSPYLWRQYYNRLPQNYGMPMVQAPLIGPTIRGIFS